MSIKNPGKPSSPAQFKANQLEATMRARNELVEAAQSMLGDKIGIPAPPRVGDFKAPEVKPVHVPLPPPEAFVDEAREKARAQAEADALEYEAQMRAFQQAGGQPVDNRDFVIQRNSPPQAPPKPPLLQAVAEKQQSQATPQAREKTPHPLLLALKKEFGLLPEETPIKVQFADHVWSFSRLSPEMMLTVANIVGSIANTTIDIEQHMRQLAACSAIVAVDDVPLWQVVGIEPEADLVKNPMFPASNVRKLASIRFYNSLHSEFDSKLLDEIERAYFNKVDAKFEVSSYLAYETGSKKTKWTCPVDGCDHIIFKERSVDAEGKYLPYFCEVHGAPMQDEKPEDLREKLNPLA